MSSTFVIHGLNPEPWTAPQVSIGRNKGKPFPRFYASAAMKAYKEAVKEEVEALLPLNWEPLDVPISLRFLFWRHLVPYETHQARTARKHEADATNLQKALEDALQGVLFTNDRNVHSVQSVIMDQGHDSTPLIMVTMSTKIELPKVLIAEEDKFDGTKNVRADFDPSEVF